MKGFVIGGRYRLDRHLGAGSVGDVWAAEDFLNGKTVAIKVLHAHHRQNKRVYARFIKEGEFLQRFAHPRIIELYDSFEESETTYLVMEYVEGESLHDAIRMRSQMGQMFPWSEIRAIVADVAAGVSAAHAKGILHRDLKPGNVLLLQEGGRLRAKVADFGIAKALEGPAHDGTTVGRVVGTPRYMAPEQCQAIPVDERADQFALGVLAFEMVTNYSPWDQIAYHARTDVEPIVIMQRVMTAERPRCSVLRAELPAELDAIVMRAMSIDPKDRYPSVAEFSQAFARAIAAHETAELLPNAPLSQVEAFHETMVVRTRTGVRKAPVWPKKPVIAALLLVVAGAALAAMRFREREKLGELPMTSPIEPTAQVEQVAQIEPSVPMVRQKAQPIEEVEEVEAVEVAETLQRAPVKTKRASPVRQEQPPIEPTRAADRAPPDLLASARDLARRSAAAPDDNALLEQLDRELTRVANAEITDDAKKKEIIRAIKASTFAGNLGGLERALKEIDAAIDRGAPR